MKPRAHRTTITAAILVLLLLALPYIVLAEDPIPEAEFKDSRELGPGKHKEYLFLLPKGNVLDVNFDVNYGGPLDLILIAENELDVYSGSGEYFRFDTGSVLNTSGIHYFFESPKDGKYYFIVENSNRTLEGAISRNIVHYTIEFEVTKPVANAEEGGICGTTVVMLSMLPAIGLTGFKKTLGGRKKGP